MPTLSQYICTSFLFFVYYSLLLVAPAVRRGPSMIPNFVLLDINLSGSNKYLTYEVVNSSLTAWLITLSIYRF